MHGPGQDDTDVTLWRAEGERSGDTAFALFSPPPAWGTDAGGERRLLPDRTYQLTFTHHEDDYNGTVAFTAGDLSGLGTGQVWADDRAMDLDEFEELAEESC
ncbi:hypothetical protein [Streptomyces akebiae]|uniref:hypothetical protein n=1 Tax=Streptomyces akebiae TaxID=2865673 RepID=UPI002175F1C2|nr:hypothetical protein [Streptomyces akebiae]